MNAFIAESLPSLKRIQRSSSRPVHFPRSNSRVLDSISDSVDWSIETSQGSAIIDAVVTTSARGQLSFSLKYTAQWSSL